MWIAQDNATTALWNAMVDNPAAVKDFNRLNGYQCLVIQLNTGTALGKELAAGAIWKVLLLGLFVRALVHQQVAAAA